MKPQAGARCLVLWGLFLISPLLLWSCQSEQQGGEAKKAIVEQVRPVKVYELKQENSHKIRVFPGAAKALQETKLSFRVPGPLVALDVDTGEFIKKGGVIARIDPRDFKIRINAMQSRLAAAKADYKEAKLQFDRYQVLITKNAAAKAAYDRIKAAYEKAEAQVETHTKGLENAKNALADTELTAPFSGYVHHQFVENNEIVRAGTPIISMVDLSDIEVIVAIPEDLVPAADRFESYVCRFSAIPGKNFNAQLKEIGKQPNPSNQTYPLTLVIEKNVSQQVRPGMAAEVSITIREENGHPVFVVPMSALINGADRQSYVWLVDPAAKKLKRQPVSAGPPRGNGFIEISGDLQSGQLIASAGANTLTADQKIRLMAPTSESNIGNEL